VSIDTFQTRFAFVNIDDGTLTPEAFRVLRTWFTRIGGYSGMSAEDLAVLEANSNPGIEHLTALSLEVEALRQQIDAMTSPAVAVGEARKYAQDIDISYSFSVPPTDFEHPGRLGFWTPNSAKVTTLDASSTVTLNPLNKLVDLSPTGTGAVRINPATLGTMDNMTIGGTTRAASSFTTVSANGQITSTVATGTAPLVVASTTEVANFRAAKATTLANARQIGGESFDGSADITVSTADGNFDVFLSITTGQDITAGQSLSSGGGFACNGRTPRVPLPLGAAATDLPTVIALSNNMRTALINNGIGS
jgi:hypothetical protein